MSRDDILPTQPGRDLGISILERAIYFPLVRAQFTPRRNLPMTLTNAGLTCHDYSQLAAQAGCPMATGATEVSAAHCSR